MKRLLNRYLIVFIFCVSFLHAQTPVQQKKILVLLSYNLTIPWERDFAHGLQTSIEANNLGYELYFEVINTERMDKYYTDEILSKQLKEKYQGITFDAVIAESDRASHFLNAHQNIFKKGIPLVYYATQKNDILIKNNIFVLSDNTEKIAFKTAQMALSHNPKLKEIYIVDGGNLVSNLLINNFKDFFQEHPQIKTHIIKDFTLEELLSRLNTLDKNSAVFYTLVFKDKDNKEYIPKSVLQQMCGVSQSPVYSMYSTLLGSGTIGGHMMDSEQIALSIVNILDTYFTDGKFDREKNYAFSNSYIDCKVANQFDLENLPSEQKVKLINQIPSIWVLYGEYLIVGIFSFLVLIIILIYTLNRKNKQKYLNEMITSELLKDQQKEIQAIKNRFQNMFLNHDAIMLLVNPKSGEIIDVNKSAVSFYGYTRSELKKMTISELNALNKGQIQEKMDEAEHFEHNYFEFPHKLKNGEIKIVEVHSSPIDVEGETILFSIIKDITKLKSYEENLKNTNIQLQDLSQELGSEKIKYQKFMENSSDGIFIVTVDGKLFEYSNVAREYLGYSDEEMKKLCVFDWDKQIKEEELKELIENIEYEKPIKFERIHTRKDGSTYDASITAIKIDLNAQQYIYASVRDITQSKKLQQEVETQKQEFETIFNYAEDSITIIDLDGNFLKFNDAFLRLTEYTKEELLSKNCSDLTAPEDQEKNSKAMQKAIERGHVENFEKTCIVKNGKRITVHVSISLLPDKQTLLLIAKDTSTLKLLEEQAKLASMGEMIGNIAHQWRQPLSIITSSASGLKVQVKYGLEVTPKNIEDFSDLIVQQAQYLSNTIDNFRDFLKGDKNYEHIKLDKVIEYTLSLVNASIKNNNITLIQNIDDSLMLNGSLNELSEAFINIINNSKDILKEKIEDEKDRLIFIEAHRDDHNIVMTFKDSGGGIPKEYIDRIFEPYFTSKHQSVGTGLGLSMAEKIIRERHSGSIHAYNEEYIHEDKEFKGACFKIVLPAI